MQISCRCASPRKVPHQTIVKSWQVGICNKHLIICLCGAIINHWQATDCTTSIKKLLRSLSKFTGWAIIEELSIRRRVRRFLSSWGQRARVKHYNIDLSSWYEFWFALICIDMNVISPLTTAIQQFKRRFQCRRKTCMVHQTFVWWALYIPYKFVKSPIRHLGLAIGNVWCVRRFSPTLRFRL